MTKLILFDIDGTLLYTGGSGRIAFEKAFEELFAVKEVWQDLVPDGKTDPIIIDEIAARAIGRRQTDVEYRQLVIRYHFHFEIEVQNPPNFIILPGVLRLLDRLAKQSDLILGIATGNFEQAAQAKLRRGKLHSFFRFGGYASDAASRVDLTRVGLERGYKLAGGVIPNQDILLIGDTPHDVHVGKTLGLPTLAVATGRTSAEEFRRQYQPEYVFEDLSDTEKFLDLIGDSPRKK